MNYNPNVYRGIHKVKVTLQQWEYTGSIVFEMGGNCKGFSIINGALDSIYDEQLVQNNCNFKFFDEEDDEGNDWFKCELINQNGEILEIEDETDDLEKYIVAVEIIDYTSDD